MESGIYPFMPGVKIVSSILVVLIQCHIIIASKGIFVSLPDGKLDQRGGCQKSGELTIHTLE